jgi:DNA-binding MarR family transcriptional regulator
MGDWSDELHAVLLRLNGYMNRPDVDQAFLAHAGVKLDRALFPLLTRIGLAHPIGVVELANLAGRDHSVVSRQVAKLEALGLVGRQAAEGDQRIRLLTPSAKGEAMLRQFSVARRTFFARRLDDWTEEDRAMLLDLLERFATTISTPERETRRGEDGSPERGVNGGRAP